MNNNEIKICFLAGTLGKGGAEKQLYLILKNLLPLNYQLSVLTFSKDEYWQIEIEKLGIRVFNIRNKNIISRIFEIKKILSNLKPDIFQSQHFYCNFYTGIISRILGIKSIGAIRGNFLHELSVHNKLTVKFLISLNNFFIANSYAAVSNYKSFTEKDNISYLNNIYELSNKKIDSIKRFDGKIILLNVGTLTNIKRQDIFIRFINEIKNENIKAFIIGDGPDRDSLINLKRSLNIPEDKLVFTGKINNLKDYYKDAHILVITSDFEGTPNVLLEAMDYKLGIICSSKAGDATHIIKDKVNGLICDNNDLTSYTNAFYNYKNNFDLINKYSDLNYEIL